MTRPLDSWEVQWGSQLLEQFLNWGQKWRSTVKLINFFPPKWLFGGFMVRWYGIGMMVSYECGKFLVWCHLRARHAATSGEVLRRRFAVGGGRGELSRRQEAGRSTGLWRRQLPRHLALFRLELQGLLAILCLLHSLFFGSEWLLESCNWWMRDLDGT